MFVPIDLLEPILDDMFNLGRAARPPRPWLGMYTAVDQGQLIVGGLAEDGPAERAGVRSAIRCSRWLANGFTSSPSCSARRGTWARQARYSR